MNGNLISFKTSLSDCGDSDSVWKTCVLLLFGRKVGLWVPLMRQGWKQHRRPITNEHCIDFFTDQVKLWRQHWASWPDYEISPSCQSVWGVGEDGCDFKLWINCKNGKRPVKELPLYYKNVALMIGYWGNHDHDLWPTSFLTVVCLVLMMNRWISFEQVNTTSHSSRMRKRWMWKDKRTCGR